MFKLRGGLASCTTRLNSDSFMSFALGSSLTLVLVLVWNLLQPAYVVERHVLEVAKQALYGIPLQP
ncbi:MAG: hypothetical protein ABI134_05845 [Byssovorax sp.]